MTDADPVSLLQTLIRHPSVSPAAAPVFDALEAALAPEGFRCTRLPFSEAGYADVDNLYARIGEGAPHFCFAGHLDVVPPGDPALWTEGPWSGALRDGEVWGRGAVDMKGGVAAFAAAAIDFARTYRKTLPGSVSLLITGDEEAVAVNGTVKMLRWLDDRGEVPDHCVVGEPTCPAVLGEALKIGRRGSMDVHLTVTGRQGHVAYPHTVINPVPRMGRMLDRLSTEPLDPGNPHFEPSSLQCVTVDTGNPAGNVVPHRVTARINIRYNSNHTPESLQAWVTRRCEDVKRELGGDYELRFDHNAPVFLTEPGPFVAVVQDAVRAVTGIQPELNAKGGTSDARFIKDYCPVVEFGPVSRTIHQVDERIAVEDLVALKRIYREMLERYFAWTER